MSLRSFVLHVCCLITLTRPLPPVGFHGYWLCGHGSGATYAGIDISLSAALPDVRVLVVQTVAYGRVQVVRNLHFFGRELGF